MNDGTKGHRIVAGVAAVILIGLSVIAPAGSTYRYSFLFLLPMLGVVYGLRRRLCLEPFHVGLFASALLLHNLGVFGFYRREFWHLQFDTYVHFYFGAVAGALMQPGLRCVYGVKGWRLWLAVTLGVLGFGALHELIEWSSTLWLGSERGMLKALADDPYDTQKDLLNNLLGTLTSLVCSALYQRLGRDAAKRVAPGTQ